MNDFTRRHRTHKTVEFQFCLVQHELFDYWTGYSRVVVWLLIGLIRGKIYAVWGGDAQNASSGSTKKQEFIEI